MDYSVCIDRNVVKRHEQFVIGCGAILNKIYYYCYYYYYIEVILGRNNCRT